MFCVSIKPPQELLSPRVFPEQPTLHAYENVTGLASGGERDPTDRDLRETALRETLEEVGSPPERVEDLQFPGPGKLLSPRAGGK
jgi:8-oxo-dGTP pyrophosphatase MutT (NUDIX family)